MVKKRPAKPFCKQTGKKYAESLQIAHGARKSPNETENIRV
jgi:hypothetical protein